MKRFKIVSAANTTVILGIVEASAAEVALIKWWNGYSIATKKPEIKRDYIGVALYNSGSHRVIAYVRET